MTYEEQRAVEQAADLAKPFSQLQEWHKDHKWGPLLLEPVIDRNKALKKAKLVKQMLKSPLRPEMPYDVGDDKDLDPSAAPKPATHAGYLDGLANRVQKNPEDKDALAVLLYAVYDDAALEIFRGKFYEGEGLTVNDSWTPEDLAKVIADTQRLAALPQHNVTQQQLDELREQDLQLQDELDDYATDGETIWRRQAEGDTYWNNLVAIWKDKPGATAADIDAATRRPAWLPSVEVGYVLDLIDRVEKGHYDDIETGHCVDANDGLDAANEVSKIFNIQPEDPITINQLVSKAWTWAMNAAPAAQEPATLTVREMILEHGINPTDVDGLDKWGNLKVVAGSVDWTHISENGVIFECAEDIRLWLLIERQKFTIEPAPWNLADGGPHGPFIDTTCRPWEDTDPPMSEYDWVKAHVDPKTQKSIPQASDYLGMEPEEQEQDEGEPDAQEPKQLDYLDTEDLESTDL